MEEEGYSDLPPPIENVENNCDEAAKSSNTASEDMESTSILDAAVVVSDQIMKEDDQNKVQAEVRSYSASSSHEHLSKDLKLEGNSTSWELQERDSVPSRREPCHENSDEQIADSSTADEDKLAEGENASTLPYSYTQDGEFTSEIYKILLQNLPKCFGFKQLRKMLEKLNLKPRRIKGTGKSSNYAFITFACEDDRQQALQVLNSHKWKGRVLTAKVAKPITDPIVALKRKQERQGDRGSDKKPKKDNDDEKAEDDLPIEERLKNAVTPLWKMDYQDQLQLKQKEKEEFLVRFGKSLLREVPMLTQWLKEQRKANNGLCCQLEQIKPSPVINGYRTKCEFSIGANPYGEGKTVGFRLGMYKGGQLSVANPVSCSNVSCKAKEVLQAFQNYIRQSDLAAYDPLTHKGHWRMLTVRTTQGSEVMAMVTFHRQTLSDEEVNKEKQNLVTYFKEGDGLPCGVTSLHIHIQRFGDNNAIEFEHILGQTHITEDLLGLKFRISPQAFFQVNTKAAEVLYATVAEWAQVSKITTLLDICCGTGTIGISLAKNVERVIGIELNQQAINDAVVNAQINGVSNVTFQCGKAEDLLPDITNRLHHSLDVVGIVDPPRAGLHPRVLQAIRRCPHLNRLIYVSCDASQALQNFLDLCRPISKKRKGIPFRPIRAIPVDMFPHANHCELVILFERNTSSKSTSFTN